MLTTKSRKQGSSVVVTLPSDKDNKPETDKEYRVDYSDDGTIILTPKMEGPFANAKEGEFYQEDVWDDMKPRGREMF